MTAPKIELSIDDCPVCSAKVEAVEIDIMARALPCGHRVIVTIWPDLRIELAAKVRLTAEARDEARAARQRRRAGRKP